ncbi:MAG: chemotaxis protein CheA [Limnochordales bacterium]|nr:chemotaxis protein CheA [Limnochordales bacterium]
MEATYDDGGIFADGEEGSGLGEEEFQLFVAESREHLHQLEEILLALEAGVLDETASSATGTDGGEDGSKSGSSGSGSSGERPIDALFRAAHTLKGNAATAGFQQMAALTHAMESLFASVREGRLLLRENPDLINLLLETVDLLNQLLSAASTTRAEKSSPEAEALLARLEKAGANHGEERAPAAEEPDAPPTAAASGASTQTPGGSEWLIKVQLRPGCLFPGVRAYQVLMAAGNWGTITAADPDVEEVRQVIAREDNSDQVWWNRPLQLRLRSSLSPTELQEAASALPDVQSVVVEQALPGESPPGDLLGGRAGSESHDHSASPSSRPGQASAPAAPTTPATAPGSPVTTNVVRVDVRLLDALMDLVGELVIDRNRLLVLTSKNGDGQLVELAQLAGHLSRLTGQLQEAVMHLRMVPVDNLFRKLPRLVRETARATGKQVRLEMVGGETELDRSLIEVLHEPMLHLIRNAIDHGIEPETERLACGKPAAGRILIRAYHRESNFYLELSDDGRGIDPDRIRQAALEKGELSAELCARLTDEEALQLIFRPGFSTRREVTEVSGRGVGLDVVQRTVERLNGTVQVESTLGQGTTFRIRLPLTLAIIRSLLVEVCGVVCAIPLVNVVEVLRPQTDNLATIQGRPVLRYRNQVLPVIPLHHLWGQAADTSSTTAALPAVIAQAGQERVALLVDGFEGEEEVVIKPLGRFLGEISGLAGTAILGDGRIALILDIPGLLMEVRRDVNHQ